MKIVFQNVIVLLSFVAYNYFCLAKDSVRVGVFFNEGQQESDINWNVIEENLDENVEFLRPEVETVSDKDIFTATKKLCDFTAKEERLLGIFGPKDELTSATLISISSHLNIPYFITSWQPKFEVESENVLNLYPDSDLFSRGLAKIVESFDWNGFVILYENEEGLLKLQDVLKLQKYQNGQSKNDVILQRLSPSWDNRHVLKTIRSFSINKIILDCHSDKVVEILQQALEVKLLSDFSISFFLTSLDAHTLDFSSLNTLANITTIRLFDPFKKSFQKTSNDYFPDKDPKEIRVENALIHDALGLITEVVNSLKSKEVEITPLSLFCNSTEKYQDSFELILRMREVELTGCLTGDFTLANGKREKFNLEVVEVDNIENPIGVWSSEFPDIIHLTRNATQREAELQKRMESYNFIVTSRIGKPYLFENANPEAIGNNRYYGYSMDLIKEVANLMKITFEFRITEDNSYANLVNDLVEKKADLGICDFTITPQRREIIDFSMPFMNLGIGILHKESAQEEVDNMYAFMRPISWTVWFYIWTLNLTISITMFFVARLAPGEWENPKPWDPESKELENIWNIKNFLWLTMGSITCQGCDILPKSIPTRIISGFWWIFSLIITSSYTANLAAFLTMSKKDVTVDNVEELAAQSKIKYGLVEKASTESFFSFSNNSLYQKMWNTMKNEKPSVFEKDNAKGVERVLSTKNSLYAFFMESTGIEYEMERKCDLRKIGALLDSKSYGIGMPMNADYRNQINAAVLILQESGKLMELKEKWWKKEREGKPCPRDSGEKSDALALANVGGIFVVLGVGIGLAYTIAILEFFWNIRRISVEEHLSYLETLKVEIKFACKIFTKKKRAKPIASESSSKSSEIDHDRISTAKSIFSNAASLINFDPKTVPDGLKNRSMSKLNVNSLRVNN